jgi:hypothetical protein
MWGGGGGVLKKPFFLINTEIKKTIHNKSKKMFSNEEATEQKTTENGNEVKFVRSWSENGQNHEGNITLKEWEMNEKFGIEIGKQELNNKMETSFDETRQINLKCKKNICLCRQQERPCEECYSVNYSIACYGINDPFVEENKCNYCIMEKIFSKNHALKLNDILYKDTNGFATISAISQADQDLKRKSFWSKIHKKIQDEVQSMEECAFTICAKHQTKNTFANNDTDTIPFYCAKKELKATNKFFGDSILTLYRMQAGLNAIDDEEEEEVSVDSTDGGVIDFIKLNYPKMEKIVKALDQMITNGFGKRLVSGELKIENSKVFYMEILHVVYKQLLTLFNCENVD